MCAGKNRVQLYNSLFSLAKRFLVRDDPYDPELYRELFELLSCRFDLCATFIQLYVFNQNLTDNERDFIAWKLATESQNMKTQNERPVQPSPSPAVPSLNVQAQGSLVMGYGSGAETIRSQEENSWRLGPDELSVAKENVSEQRYQLEGTSTDGIYSGDTMVMRCPSQTNRAQHFSQALDVVKPVNDEQLIGSTLLEMNVGNEGTCFWTRNTIREGDSTDQMVEGDGEGPFTSSTGPSTVRGETMVYQNTASTVPISQDESEMSDWETLGGSSVFSEASVIKDVNGDSSDEK